MWNLVVKIEFIMRVESMDAVALRRRHVIRTRLLAALGSVALRLHTSGWKNSGSLC